MDVPLHDVESAAKAIEGVVRRTPVVDAPGVDGVHLKLENLQRLGSFKLRGVANRVGHIHHDDGAGLATVSAGNHGLAVAWMAKRRGLPCTVWTPPSPNPAKVAAMEALGATVRSAPFDELAKKLRGEAPGGPGVFVHPFADPQVVAGQGTVGLEVKAQVPDARTLVVPVGGGGLASGILAAYHDRRRQVRVVGVEAEAVPALARSMEAGEPVRVEARPTICDGIAVPLVFESMWPVLRTVDEVVTVSEEEVRSAMRRLALEAHVVAEGAGAVAYAAALREAPRWEPPVVAVVSGGNVAPGLLADVVA